MRTFRAFLVAAMLVLSTLSTFALTPVAAMASPIHATSISRELPIRQTLVQHVALANKGPSTYTVRSGDSLSAIAQPHKLSWEGLYCENRHTVGEDPNLIFPGQKLTLTSKNCTIQAQAQSPVTTDQLVPTRITKTPPPPTHVGSGATAPYCGNHAEQALCNYAYKLVGYNSSEDYCLNGVVMIESGWNVYAYNPSGAYGIPQSLPGSKMAAAGPDWYNDGYTQLVWMIKMYIPQVYGDSCAALQHEHTHGWY